MAAIHCGFRTISRRLFMPTGSYDLAPLLRNKSNAYVFVYSRCSSTNANGNQKLAEPPNNMAQARKFDLTFEEYQKLRRKLRTRQRIAGLPVGAVALLTSSAVSAYLNPNMFDATPEQIQPIM